jgi:branched-chain amino acid transport system permease protein
MAQSGIINYIIHLLVFVVIYFILSLGLQINLGFTGINNFAMSAYFGLSGYSYSIISKIGVNPYISIILAITICIALAFIHHFITLKLNGESFVLVSIALIFVFYTIDINFENLTGGPKGLYNIPKPDILNNLNNLQFGIIIIFIGVITYFVQSFFKNNRLFLIFKALRDNSITSTSLGININNIKLTSLIIASILFSISGIINAVYIGFLDPSIFKLDLIISIISIVIIGGLTSIDGALIASLLVILIPESLRFLKFSSTSIDPIRKILFSIILILVLYYKPEGLFSKKEN